MFTDLTGYTKAMSEMSREQIEQFLSAHERIVRPVITVLRGKVIKTGGDSFLAVFESPTDAVLAGTQIQEAVDEYNKLVKPDERMEIRVSINVGEVTEKDGDIFGDAVNVASRLLSVAEKNGVYFTEAVYLVMNKKEVPTAEVGYRQFKGVPEKIKVYRVLRELPARTTSTIVEEEVQPISLPSVPVKEMKKARKRIAWPHLLSMIFFGVAGVSAIVSIVLQANMHRQAPMPPPQVVASASTPQPVPKTTPKPKKTKTAKKLKSKPHPLITISHPSPKPPQVKPKPVPHSPPAMVEISSSPSGAEIFVDGKAKGDTDLGFPLKPGAHDIKLVKQGFENKEVILEVKPGQSLQENFGLEKRN